jgi:hypothetical protein
MNKSPNFLQALIAVLWAFIGIRNDKASLADRGVRPIHFVIAGLIAVACFVVTLLIVVRLIITAAA